MESTAYFHSIIWPYIIMPLLIVIARVTDVSIGTMRVIFVSRGYKLFAAICGFFEVLVWILAITQIMQNLTNPLYYIAYAAGFATGNYVGMFIEEKIALGNVLIRVITPNDVSDLIEYLKDQNYGITLHDAEGLFGMVKILFTIIPRSEIDPVVSYIQQVNPQAFYTIEDVRFVNEMNRSYHDITLRRKKPRLFRRSIRKGK